MKSPTLYKPEVRLLYSLQKPDKYCPLTLSIRVGSFCLQALIDTGAFIKAISLDQYAQIQQQPSHAILSKSPEPSFEICVASKELIEMLFFCSKIKLELAVGSFSEEFLILYKMKDILLGMTFV